MKLTANRLTLLRILLLPLPCALLYGGPTAKLTAIGVASLLGLTDYFDGKLARRQGVTRLGALLDPIADKIFVAVFYLFLARLQYLPLWLVGLLLSREFLITALRKMVPGHLPVSWLAKLKTSLQMLAAGLVVVVEVFPSWRLWALSAAALVLVTGVWCTRFTKGQKLLVSLLALLLPILAILPPKPLPLLLGLLALFFTWLSAGDYLRQAWCRLWAPESFLALGDALALPLVAIVLMPYTGRLWLVVPLVLIVELARQALGLISRQSPRREALFGILALGALGSWWFGEATLGLVAVLLFDLFFTAREALRLRGYLQA